MAALWGCRGWVLLVFVATRTMDVSCAGRRYVNAPAASRARQYLEKLEVVFCLQARVSGLNESRPPVSHQCTAVSASAFPIWDMSIGRGLSSVWLFEVG